MDKTNPKKGRWMVHAFAGLICVTIVAVGFVLYEIIEHFWLFDADPRMIFLLHIVSGVGASVLAGLFVSWYILRSGTSIFPIHTLDDDSLSGKEPDSDERIRHFGQWFIRMRWIVFLVVLVLLVPAINVLHLLPEANLWPLLGLTCCLAGANVFFSECLRRGRHGRLILNSQIYADIILLTLMLHFAGGIENPLFFLYHYHIMISGIILERRKCYGVAAMATLFLCILAIRKCLNILPITPFPSFPTYIPVM